MKDLFIKGITSKHTGKMERMLSFSTSTANNNFCTCMRNINGSVCQKCYAYRMVKRLGAGFRNKLVNNEWIKYTTLEKKDIPILNAGYFRFESFGELETLTQLENYFKIAKYNPQTRFALFTKRSDLLRRVDKDLKPSNMNIILSSIQLNKPTDYLYEIQDLIDAVFTVYTKEYAKENNITISCGDRKCIECLKCYNHHNGIIYINELVK